MTILCHIRYVIDPFKLTDNMTSRRRLQTDKAAATRYRFAQESRIIFGERRMFVRPARGHAGRLATASR